MCFKSIVNLFLAAIIMVFTACGSSKSYNARRGKNTTVTDDKKEVEMDVRAYHFNDSITKVFYRINVENILFKRIDTSRFFFANIHVACKLLPDINSRTIIDSTSTGIEFQYPEDDQSKFIESSFALKLKPTEYAYLDFWMIDNFKNLKHTQPIFIDKRSKGVGQYYTTYLNNKLAYKNTFYKGDEVKIVSNINAGKTVVVDCFLKDFGPALPPFSVVKSDEMKYKPDSSFTFVLDSKTTLTMPNKGFYHIKSNTESFDGLTLFTFERAYPGVSDIDEMINSTRYIMNKAEFEACKTAPDKKQSIDNFWLAIGGSNERAKELLKKYYGRVMEANKQFTSYLQGWKTDRGMISIVFGEPTNIYKSKTEEIWFYGIETDINSLKFVFRKTENPFSENDFILQRSYIYQTPWYDVVDFWRQGRISIEK